MSALFGLLQLANVQGLNPVPAAVFILCCLSLVIFAYQFTKKKQPGWFLIASYGILFLGWTGLLIRLGLNQNACPIHGLGQVFIFLAWSLILFYLLAGTAYRLSLLGLVTAPVVALIGFMSLSVGVEEALRRTTLWGDLHVGISILAYAGYALAAIASVSFYIQDKHLKQRKLEGIFLHLPPVQLLYKAAVNLIGIGSVLLTVGLIFAFFSDKSAPVLKLYLAWGTWGSYVALWIGVKIWGMPPRKFALINIALFLLSLTVLFATR